MGEGFGFNHVVLGERLYSHECVRMRSCVHARTRVGECSTVCLCEQAYAHVRAGVLACVRARLVVVWVHARACVPVHGC